MKNRFKHITIGLVIGCLLSLFFWDLLLSEGSEVIEVRYDSLIYRVDSIEVPIPYEVIEYVNKVKTVYKTDTFTIDMTQPVDSAEILADYIRTRLYKDTIRDSDMVAYISDSIQYNRIKSRQFSYQILRPETIIQKSKASFYLGGYLYNSGVVPYAQYNRNNWSVSLGVDPVNSSVFIGGGFKIK